MEEFHRAVIVAQDAGHCACNALIASSGCFTLAGRASSKCVLVGSRILPNFKFSYTYAAYACSPELENLIQPAQSELPSLAGSVCLINFMFPLHERLSLLSF
jgi:hypothetical protein